MLKKEEVIFIASCWSLNWSLWDEYPLCPLAQWSTEQERSKKVLHDQNMIFASRDREQNGGLTLKLGSSTISSAISSANAMVKSLPCFAIWSGLTMELLALIIVPFWKCIVFEVDAIFFSKFRGNLWNETYLASTVCVKQVANMNME